MDKYSQNAATLNDWRHCFQLFVRKQDNRNSKRRVSTPSTGTVVFHAQICWLWIILPSKNKVTHCMQSTAKPPHCTTGTRKTVPAQRRSRCEQKTCQWFHKLPRSAHFFSVMEKVQGAREIFNLRCEFLFSLSWKINPRLTGHCGNKLINLYVTSVVWCKMCDKIMQDK